MPHDVTMHAPADPVTAIAGYLHDENDVLRCSAVRALAGTGGGSGAVRQKLIEALVDPDPDVRSDAMEALATIAQPEDAETIRRSLAGDPVREVKLAAISALGRLRDAGSAELLRALVRSRSEDSVAWEDEDSDWEEWLDIQVAAIAALGDIGVGDVIPDMLTARRDEQAQNLDTPVFEALSKLGSAGVATLLSVIEGEGGLAAQRASAMLSKAAPDRLRPHIDTLLASPDAVLRATAAALLPSDGDRIAELVTFDPDPHVRSLALERAAAAQPALVLEGLRDRDAAHQATALRLLTPPLQAEVHDALVDNMLAWLETAPDVLMLEAAEQLARWAPNRSTQPLLGLATDPDRPLGVRVAAVRGLGQVRPAVETALVAGLLDSPAQQVRTAALVLLRARAKQNDAEALHALSSAIAGTLLSTDVTPRAADQEVDAPDLAVPKGDGPGRQRIRITSEGDIVHLPAEDTLDEISTLAAIQGQGEVQAVAQAEDTPEERPEKRRKRRAVEGPDDVVEALAREAMQICGDLDIPLIAQGVLVRASEASDPLRRHAWQAIDAGRHVADASDDAVAAARQAMADPDPVIRLAAIRLLFRATDAPDALAAARKDPDPLIRAEAVSRLPISALCGRLGDNAQPVRQAAVQRLVQEGTDAQIQAGVSALVGAERSDTLATLIQKSTAARSGAADTLADPACAKRKALVFLEAFAQARSLV